MLHTRKLSGDVSVDGADYAWELRREPQWCTTDGWRGMEVAVRAKDGQREAMLQFPMPKRPLNGSPHRQRPQINPAIIANGVQRALDAGWEPLSRGRPIPITVDAEGCKPEKK